MWRYPRPTDEEAKIVKRLLRVKLSGYITDTAIVPIDEKFDPEEALKTLLRMCYKNTKTKLHDTLLWVTLVMKFPLACPRLGLFSDMYDSYIDSKEQEIVMTSYSIPSHKVYVETQWKYVLELLTCHIQSRRLLSTLILGYISDGQRPTFLDDETSGSDFVSSLASICFGVPLTNPFFSPDHYYIPFPSYRRDWVPRLRIRGLPQFGNIILMDSGFRSIDNWFEQIQSFGYEVSIDIINRNIPAAWDFIGYLTQLTAHQVMCRCKLGFITDGKNCIFTTILNVSKESITLKLDVTILADTFTETPLMYPPVALMIAKIAEIHQMSSEHYRQETERTFKVAGDWPKRAYLDFHHSEYMADKIFLELKKSFPQLQYYEWSTKSDADTQIGWVSKTYSWRSEVILVPKNYMEKDVRKAIPGRMVAVMVMDNVKNLELPSKGYLQKTTDKLASRYRMYQKFVRMVDDYNDTHSCKINTIPRIFGDYCCFYKDHTVPINFNNYVSCGLSVMMPYLTQKPKTREDFLKGLKQLIIMNRAGLANLHVRSSSMFMYNGEFVFTNPCEPDASFGENSISHRVYALEKQVDLFKSCWRYEDSAITIEYVWERVSEIVCELDEFESKQNDDLKDLTSGVND